MGLEIVTSLNILIPPPNQRLISPLSCKLYILIYHALGNGRGLFSPAKYITGGAVIVRLSDA